MSPEAQRIAIAEVCPNIRQGDGTWMYLFDGCWHHCRNNDPLSDLNAMHEAEKVLHAQATDYRCHEILEEVVLGNNPACLTDLEKARFAQHATAAQRAEAFLRTLGKWEDDK